MDVRHTKRLQENRVTIVTDLEPRGKVLDSLYEDGILTENDLEQISAGRTRKDRCHLLLAMLPTRGPTAYGSFQRALCSGRYNYLADTLGPVPEVSQAEAGETLQTERHCQECPTFLQKLQHEMNGAEEDETVGTSPFGEILERYPCLILENIEPTDVIDQLLQDDVISQTESEKIRACTTRRDRCEVLTTFLYSSQSNRLVQSFKIALKKKYNFINEIIFGDSVRTNDVTAIQLLNKRRALEQDECQEEDREVDGEHSSITHCKMTEDTAGDSDTDLKQTTDLNLELSTKEDLNATAFESLRLSGESLESEESRTLVDEETILKDVDDVDEEELETIKADAGNKMQLLALGVNEVEGVMARGECAFPPKREATETFDDVDGIVVLRAENVQDKSSQNRANKQNYNGNAVKNKKRVRGKKTLTKATNVNIDEAEETEHNVADEVVNNVPANDQSVVVSKSMSNFPSEGPGRRLSVAFNYLSTLINQGDFTKFENISSQLKFRFPRNYDLMCILGYLHASRDLFRTDFDSAKANINSTMDLALKSTNPRYFMLELYTAKTRMYITQKKLEKLQSALDEALMILETDPVGCTGRAAGWLYNNNARNITTQLTCLNLSKANAMTTYNRLFERAKSSFQRSMTNFKKDGGKDGPFGFGFALCRLVILLLRCGDNGKTMQLLTPTDVDVTSAGNYLDHLENSDIPIPKILDMHLRLAKCDYHFRRRNLVRALEHAEMAYSLASELKMLEFTEHAYNRLSFLRSKEPVTARVTEITDEEANRILFGDSSDTDTQGEY